MKAYRAANIASAAIVLFVRLSSCANVNCQVSVVSPCLQSNKTNLLRAFICRLRRCYRRIVGVRPLQKVLDLRIAA